MSVRANALADALRVTVRDDMSSSGVLTEMCGLVHGFYTE